MSTSHCGHVLFLVLPVGVLQGVGVVYHPGLPFPSRPVICSRLTALSGNYYLGDKYGDKAVLACKMYEVSGHWERCT